MANSRVFGTNEREIIIIDNNDNTIQESRNLVDEYLRAKNTRLKLIRLKDRIALQLQNTEQKIVEADRRITALKEKNKTLKKNWAEKQYSFHGVVDLDTIDQMTDEELEARWVDVENLAQPQNNIITLDNSLEDILSDDEFEQPKPAIPPTHKKSENLKQKSLIQHPTHKRKNDQAPIQPVMKSKKIDISALPRRASEKIRSVPLVRTAVARPPPLKPKVVNTRADHVNPNPPITSHENLESWGLQQKKEFQPVHRIYNPRKVIRTDFNTLPGSFKR